MYSGQNGNKGLDMEESFSRRHGFYPQEEEIGIRNDAPYDMRGVIVDIAYGRGFSPQTLRPVVCRALRKRPNPNNWSEYPNIDEEIRNLLDDCEWYKVYDVIEEICRSAYPAQVQGFETDINFYFREEGIGWQLISGQIEVRGEEVFEAGLKTARRTLEQSGLQTASKEIHEAILDLSRRPNTDITGAIQHSMAALECVAREVSRDQRATLGDILKKYEGLIPKPLDKSIEKAWGFASEMGRHLREGRTPSFEEAELILGLCGSISTYLVKKHSQH
jgi:AbiJ N-terminal domain 4